MQKYRKCSDVVESLRKMIENQVRHSSYILPGEIAMAAEVGASRTTLRKALAQLELDGVIRRDRNVTEIIERRDVLSRCGKILFTASTCHSTFILPAYEWLWMKLGPEVLSQGGNIELFSINHTTSASEWQAKLSEADVLLLTACDVDKPNELKGLLNQVESDDQKRVFSFMEEIPAETQIYLDNYSVGFLAAKSLINAGCSKVAAISFDYNINHNRIFEKRVRGFVDCLKEHSMLSGDCVKLVDYPHAGRFHSTIGDRYSSDARRIIEMVYRDGYDGVFLISDEDIGIIGMNLFQQNIIPEKMKLITVNGVGDAMRHQPPISCVNHATEEIVRIAMNKLRLIADKKAIVPEIIAVKPGLYTNETLGMDT